MMLLSPQANQAFQGRLSIFAKGQKRLETSDARMALRAAKLLSTEMFPAIP
jgi:hypothetical protein